MKRRSVAERLYQGSRHLSHRITTGITSWVSAGEDRRDRVVRIACAVAVLVVLPLLIGIRPSSPAALLAVAGLATMIIAAALTVPVLAAGLALAIGAATTPMLMLPATCIWLYLAYRATRTPDTAQEAHAPDPDEEHAADDPDQPTIDPLLQLCAQLTGDAPGVHIHALTQALNEAAPDRTRDGAEVCAALARLGVPTRASIGAPEGAVPGAPRKVRKGVKREDLQAVIGPLSDHQTKTPPEPVATAVATPLTSGVATPVGPVATPVARPEHAKSPATQPASDTSERTAS